MPRSCGIWKKGPAVENRGGRLDVGPRDAEGGDRKKRVELVSCRAQVAFVKEEFAVSERRACGLMGMDRSSYRYRARPERDTALKEEVRELARKRPRFGYRRLTAVLRRQRRQVNHKRVRRICVQERLSVR